MEKDKQEENVEKELDDSTKEFMSLLEKYKNGDAQQREYAQTQIWLKYVKGLAVIIRKKRFPSYDALHEDMIQSVFCVTGKVTVKPLMEYLMGYDPNKGKISTYLLRHIEKSMKACISENSLEYVSEYYSSVNREIQQAEEQLKQYNVEPTDAVVSRLTGIPQPRIHAARLNKPEFVFIDDENSYINLSEGIGVSPENVVIKSLETEVLNDALGELTSDELQIFQYMTEEVRSEKEVDKYGNEKLSTKKPTFSHLADISGLSLAETRRNYNNALERLKKHRNLRMAYFGYENLYDEEIEAKKKYPPLAFTGITQEEESAFEDFFNTLSGETKVDGILWNDELDK